ncbi:Hypp7026 [Branchiostoma lanceolatum]|uniref:Hypp7026 protein n=1 Tax=Branchiostoma lanceolatum TaxID=7740 RepID=A0A8J9YWL6_BRALA|nr:Hypp7026 [Branchiostoma lanceolatum]
MLFLLLTVVREDRGFVESALAVAGAAFPDDSTGYLRSAFQESVEIIRNNPAIEVTWTGMSINASFDTDVAFQAFCDYVKFPGRRVMVTVDTVGMGLGVGGLATQLGIPLISVDNNLDLNSDNKTVNI